MSTETAILDAAFALLVEHGAGGMTTRAVCDAVGIKSPTLYHYFGDKEGLEVALVQRGLADFMRRKKQLPVSADPLDQLREGWDVALDFALKWPALYGLFLNHARTRPELTADAYAVMQARVQRLVDMGRLLGPVDKAACAVWAASQGAMSLVAQATPLPRAEVLAVSDLLFNAIIAELSPPVG